MIGSMHALILLDCHFCSFSGQTFHIRVDTLGLSKTRHDQIRKNGYNIIASAHKIVIIVLSQILARHGSKF